MLSLPVNVAALVPMVRGVRAVAGTAVLTSCAVSLLWHGFALGTPAGWWASGFVGAFYLASSVPVSFAYQVAMCAAFAAVLEPACTDGEPGVARKALRATGTSRRLSPGRGTFRVETPCSDPCAAWAPRSPCWSR